jgi:MoaA/NifB/PqqE/SkfB family radical SAM enzyme
MAASPGAAGQVPGLSAETAGPVLTVPGAPPAFHVMAKPTGAVCNLDCEYCFFLSKEMLYPGSRFRMAAGLQETYLRQLLEAHARAPEVVVAWQGGEPTMMGLDFFRRAIDLQRQYARPGQRILNTIQTNGTLLDDEWGEFLKASEFLVGISIDGPAEMHDAYRVDKGGKPTFGRVMAGLEVLKRHGVDWNVLTTIHAVNGDHGRQVYAFLRDELGAGFIQFIPVIERATEQTPARRRRRLGSRRERPPALHPGRRPGHPPLGRPGPVRPVPDRRVRGMGPPRHRHHLRADVRHRAGELVRRRRRDVRARQDLRQPARPGAHR